MEIVLAKDARMRYQNTGEHTRDWVDAKEFLVNCSPKCVGEAKAVDPLNMCLMGRIEQMSG